MRTVMWRKGAVLKIMLVIFLFGLILAYITSRVLSRGVTRIEVRNFQESWTSGISFDADSILDVFVVEEHHDVLPYWFEAARRKIIPKSGNTLIHIDGHSDLAPPYYFYEFPFFRSPRDWKEVRAMMQKNDAFIIGASMGNLFKRVIWIWPLWDKWNHESPYIRQIIEIGIASVSNSKNHTIKEKIFCMCEKNITTSKRSCRFIPLEETTLEESDGREVSAGLCKIKKTIVYEEIREDKVLEKLSKEDWLSQNENFILDIDEDYYGCTHAVQPLLDVNMTMKTIELINTVIEQLVCPKTLAQEKLADIILVQALEILRRPNYCSRSGKLDANGLFPCKTDARVKEAENLISKTLWSTKNPMACSKGKNHSDQMMIKYLIDLFKHLKSIQARVLEKVGFCLTTTLKSFQPTSESLFHICHGANIPGMSIVLIHNPAKGEVPLRTKVLKKILTSVEPYKPQMVTLCRSVRDGYTPRRLFNQIESDVAKSLNSSFKNVRFNYDEGLLGGKNGWPNRHETSKHTKAYK